jgi:glutamine synthetase
LKHAPEITSLIAQWVNSYKRLVPGYEAPVYRGLGPAQPFRLVRVPMYKPGKERHPLRTALPRPGLQPLPGVRGMLAAG